MPDTRDDFRSPPAHLPRVWLFPLLGFTGGGIGALVALFLGMSSWTDARLFVLSGAALGLGLASVLAPNLLKEKHREASAPKQ